MEFLRYPFSYQRLKTRVVKIGDLYIGGEHPIYVQSMLTSSTQDTKGCLAEIKSLLQVGCRLIRLTIPSRKDLDAVSQLRRQMKEDGLDACLVADIHFSPTLAVDACELFEKVRINPGNFSDTPKSSKTESDHQSFEEGYERLKKAILPLAVALKKHQRVLRIGVNQGSLSTRMMERFGDSPLGMVSSALEMVELFEDQGVDQLVISLKSSNPIVIQKAYRLLVEKQQGREIIPMHLGVTEAGDGTMGRIKSLTGIGPLLTDGIGDTIRISLTEDSVNEILFANELLPIIYPKSTRSTRNQKYWQRSLTHQRIKNATATVADLQLGGGSPLKIGSPQHSPLPDIEIQFAPDFTYAGNSERIFLNGCNKPILKVKSKEELLNHEPQPDCLALAITSPNPVTRLREYYQTRESNGPPIGYLLPDSFDYYLLTQLAAVLSEGLLDFILISEGIENDQLQCFLYLLQATRSKILVTDYITCPSCGRTLFDIQTTTARIKQRTSHLRGLKIGVMGCIVNGPGEMADADFGYVGSGAGKVDLYFGQERVCRGIDESQAVDRLLDLIKEKGYWQEA